MERQHDADNDGWQRETMTTGRDDRAWGKRIGFRMRNKGIHTYIYTYTWSYNSFRFKCAETGERDSHRVDEEAVSCLYSCLVLEQFVW